jgi:dTDP-4-dehydrorhamnose reductase
VITRRILVTGGTGQIGRDLGAIGWPENFKVDLPSRFELDLTNPSTIRSWLAQCRYDAVVNCAAYTAVERAESERQLAFDINATGVLHLAQETGRCRIPLLHISTDYVFDGEKAQPYTELDEPNPLNVYGASKRAGEEAVRLGNENAIILRTAWLMSEHGTNFLKTILRRAIAGERLRVVNDQIGSPTATTDVAHCIVTLTNCLIIDEDAPRGTYHFVNDESTSWHGLACEILAIASQHRIPYPDVEPVSTTEYPTSARRPRNSVLSTEKLRGDYRITPRSFQSALADLVPPLVERLQGVSDLRQVGP